MKKCSKCSVLKTSNMFHKCRKHKDGLSYTCKACAAAYRSQWYWHEGGQAYQKQYSKTSTARTATLRWNRSERGKAYTKKWETSADGMAWRRENARLMRERWPGRCKARNAISHAVSAGQLPRVNSCTCLRCGAQAESRHHYLGYAEKHRLDVIELCRQCHADASVAEKARRLKDYLSE